MSDQQTYKDEYAESVLKRYKASQEYCKPYFDRFMDNYKHYFLRIIDEAVESDPEAYPFYSQLMLPISYQIVETLQPRMFSRLPSFSIKTEEMNDERAEKYLENLIKYQMQHPYLIDDPVYSRMATASKELFITGNAWGSVPWQLEEAEVEEYQPYSVELGLTEPSWENLDKIKFYGLKPQWKLVKVKKKVIDAPVFQHDSVFHVFPDPKKKRVSDLGWAIIEKPMTPTEIERMINMSPESYDPKAIEELHNMMNNKEWGQFGDNNYDDQLAGIFNSSDKQWKDDSTGEGQMKVWVCREKGAMKIVVNEKLTIRNGGNPDGTNQLGLFLMKDIPIPHELFAWGEPDPIKRIEDTMTDQINMRTDAIFYDLLRMWEVDPSALIEGENFIPEPGGVIEVAKDKLGSAVRQVDTGTVKATAYKEYEEWDKVLQNTTGVSDYVRGGADPSMTDTASGIDMLQRAANARFNMKLQLFENLGLKAMGTMYVQRNMRYFDTPQMVEIDGQKVKVEPDVIREIRGNIHFIVDAGSTESTNKVQEAQKWKNLVSMYGKPPFDNLSQEAADAWARRVLYSQDETDVDTLLKRAPLPANINIGAIPGANNANNQQNTPAVQENPSGEVPKQ